MSIKQAISQIQDYFDNPFNYIDKATLEFSHGYGSPSVSAKVKTIEEALGFEELGEGNFSKVYDIQSNRVVLKVNSNHEDVAYAAWIEFCRKKQGNPYIPRVYGVFTVGDKTAYLLERLEPINHYEDKELSDVANSFGSGASASPVVSFNDPLLQEIVDEFGYRNFNDAYSRNLMKRPGTQQMVITDPTSSLDSQGQRRVRCSKTISRIKRKHPEVQF